jgi:hypothetical protein
MGDIHRMTPNPIAPARWTVIAIRSSQIATHVSIRTTARPGEAARHARALVQAQQSSGEAEETTVCPKV